MRITNIFVKITTRMSKFKILLISITLLALACSRDSFEPMEIDCSDPFVYNGDIKDIIDATCAYSGCHDGAGGIGPGDYTSYAGLATDLQSGSFENRVINQKDDPIIGMPPDTDVYPQSQISDLTEEQLAKITCWLQAGFPEN